MTHTPTPEQPEALRMADVLETREQEWADQMTKEFRRLYARVQELEAQTAHMADLVDQADYARQKMEEAQAWLAKCRDALPAPEPGSELEHMMFLAINGPDNVASYVEAWAKALQAQRVPLDYHEIAIAHPHIGSHGQLKATERIVRWTERRHGITQEKQG